MRFSTRSLTVTMMLVFVGLALATVTTVPPLHAQPETGTIAGHVRLTAKVRAPLPASAYPTRSISRHEAPATPEIQNVVVYLKDATFHGTLPVTKVELHQQNETFVPHVLAITKGSTVDFPNDDPFFHNVFSLSSASTFNLGRYPRGETRPWKFTRPGLVKVFCDIHSHMSASILVLDHPYFAMPTSDGSFELAGIPAGQYTVIGWHERVGERAATVQVLSGQTTTIDLTVPIEDVR